LKQEIIIMSQLTGGQYAPEGIGFRRLTSIMFWLALSTGLAVSVFSLIEELCMATACSDAASFTFFGVALAWLGIAYFSFMILLLWLRPKVVWCDWVLNAMLFAGIGAELRLLWIQKYIIGAWCPLCVTICCALFVAVMLRVIEKILDEPSGQGRGSRFLRWLAPLTIFSAIGLAVAVVGVKALT
jgi:hypothetical protein